MSIGSVAVITGAAQGIGAATAALLAGRGWQIAVLDINADGAAEQAACLEQNVPVEGTRHLGLGCDVAEEHSVTGAMADVTDEFGRIDAVISGAGNLVRSSAQSLGTEDWRRHLDIHLTGTFLLARTAYPHLCASRGSLVTIASVAATFGMPRRLAYAAAKSGIVGLTRTLATEWGPDGIRVNAVAPGYVNTEMIQSGFRTGTLDQEALITRTPLRRLAEPDEVARVIAFLTSFEASFVNGVMLPVDGGLIVDGTFDAPSR